MSTEAPVETIREALPSDHEWDQRETALLALAEAQAADIDRLETDIAENGVRVDGRGAEVLNQAFCEVRQASARSVRAV